MKERKSRVTMLARVALVEAKAVQKRVVDFAAAVAVTEVTTPVPVLSVAASASAPHPLGE